MSGQPLQKPSDAAKYRAAYLSTLSLQAKNDAVNLNANSVYKETKQPSAPPDTRSTTEKLADVEKLKVELLGDLLKIADGQTSQAIITSLEANEVQYLAQNMPLIINELKSQYAKGISKVIFLNYLRKSINQSVLSASIALGVRDIAGDGLVGDVAQLISQAPLPQQWDLLMDAMKNTGRTEGIRAIAQCRDFFINMGGLNEKLKAFPAPLLPPIMTALNSAFRNVPTRYEIDGYLSQVRLGGQAQINAINLISQTFREAIETMNDMLPAVDAEMTRARAIVMGNRARGGENFVPEYNQPNNNYYGAPQSRMSGAEGNGFSYGGNSNTGGRDVPAMGGGGYRPSSSSGELNAPLLEAYAAPQARAMRDITNMFQSVDDFNDYQPEEIYAWYKSLPRQIAGRDKASWVDEVRLNSRSTWRTLMSALTPLIEAILEQRGDGDLPVAVAEKEGANTEGFEGSGLRRFRRVRGSGLRKSPTPKIDGVNKTPVVKYNWTGMGDKLIHKGKLEEGILSMRHPSGRAVVGLPVQHISANLGRVVKKIVGGELPSYDDVEILTEDEKEKLQRVGKAASLQGSAIGAVIPKKNKEQQELLEFDILRGEVLAGNDNKGMLKRFKLLLIKFGDEGKLPPREVRDVLMTLAAQGL